MNNVSLLTVGAAALVALSACTPRAPQPAPTPAAAAAQPAAPDLAQTLTAPAMPPLPVAECRGPANGSITVARGETKDSGSVRFFYAGRDHSYRTTPYVYILDTNATLLNSRSESRRSTTFGMWRGHSQTIEACGQRYAVSLVRATDEQATLGIRRR